MKKLISILMAMVIVVGVAFSPAYAASSDYSRYFPKYVARIWPYDYNASYPNGLKDPNGYIYYTDIDLAIKDSMAVKAGPVEISDSIENNVVFQNDIPCDTIYLLDDIDTIGTSGINKGVVIDLCGYKVGTINPGTIPADEALIITSDEKGGAITGSDSLIGGNNDTGLVYIIFNRLSVKGKINVGSHEYCLHNIEKSKLQIVEGSGTAEFYPDKINAERERLAEQQKIEEQKRLEEEAALREKNRRLNASKWESPYNYASGYESEFKQYNLEVTISGAVGLAHFLNLVNNGNTFEHYTVKLTADIDLDYGINYYHDAMNNGSTVFKGTFDGQNHVIYGLSILTPTNTLGFFSKIENATIKNVSFKGVTFGNLFGERYVNPDTIRESNKDNLDYGNNNYGVIAGEVYGQNNIIQNVEISIDENGAASGHERQTGVCGYSNIGSIVGRIDQNAKLKLENCHNSVPVAGCGDYIGGLIGLVDIGAKVEIYDCTNDGPVITTRTENMHPLIDWYGTTTIDLVRSQKSGSNKPENHEYGRNAGGIIGACFGSVDMQNCYNNAFVLSDQNGDAGGIIGIIDWNTFNSCSIDNCVNRGEVLARDSAGGIVGWIGCDYRPYGESLSIWSGFEFKKQSYGISNCKNYGAIKSTNAYAGGTIGHLAVEGTGQYYDYNENHGSITSVERDAGGICGYSEAGGSWVSCKNTGSVTGGESAAGIVGRIQDDASSFSMCSNTAYIKGKMQTGGIVGSAGDDTPDPRHSFSGCNNSGTIESTESDAGGIAGILDSDNEGHTFSGCVNTGTVKGFRMAGGICGYTDGYAGFSSCTSNATVTSTGDNGCHAGGLIGSVEDDYDMTDYVIECSISGKITSKSGYADKYCGRHGSRNSYTASTFTSGNVWMVVSLAEILIFGIVIVILAVKLKKKGTN